MTDVEKLKALIELAWENGYDFLLKEARADSYGNFVVWGAPEDFQLCSDEHILFSHDFIKALCRANHERLARPGRILGPSYLVATDWETQIQKLALSTNRIEYLWEEFGNG